MYKVLIKLKIKSLYHLDIKPCNILMAENIIFSNN